MLDWSTLTLEQLCQYGIARIAEFCDVNHLPTPHVTITPTDQWEFNPCAYYRPAEGIHICLSLCAKLAGEVLTANWNWPGNTTDREPYGVLAHELGHHLDWHASDTKGTYYGNYSADLRKETLEPPITNYTPNDAEWFAEICRLYITNHALLQIIRPNTWAKLRQRWTPTSPDNWRDVLGPNVPQRVLNAIRNKFQKIQ